MSAFQNLTENTETLGELYFPYFVPIALLGFFLFWLIVLLFPVSIGHHEVVCLHPIGTFNE